MATAVIPNLTPITPAARVMQVADNLLRITSELAEAKADVALLNRITGAQARADALAVEQAKALNEQQSALNAEEKLKLAARFEGLQGIDIEDVVPHENVIRSLFRISYTRLSYDPISRDNLPKVISSNGFGTLPASVLNYLIEVHPAKIPHKIMDLAPGDPLAAFQRYFMGQKKGYLTA